MTTNIGKRKTYKITPLPEALQVQPVKDDESQFTATIPRDWCAIPAAHGGYLQSLIFSTARAYFLTYHPARNQPDPINTHVQFLKPVLAGHVRLSVEVISLGTRVSVIQIRLQAEDAKSPAFQTCVLATVMQGNLATEKGVSLPTEPILEREELLDRERDCNKNHVAEFVKSITPTAAKLDGWVVPPSIRKQYSDHRERSHRAIWYSFSDGSNWDVLSLGYLTDAFPGAPNNYCLEDEDYKRGILYPTLSMVTEIKKDPKDAKWLFMRVKAHKIKNGRFDIEVVVVDESGDLILLSRHVSLALARKSPEELERIYKL